MAPTGSVTAVNTIGMSLVAATTACADGVEIGTITSGFVADELLRDLRRGRRIALRALVTEVEIVALHEAFGGELVLDAVARGVERRMLDDRGDRHGLELLGEGGSGGQEQRQGGHGAERSGARQSAMREH